MFVLESVEYELIAAILSDVVFVDVCLITSDSICFGNEDAGATSSMAGDDRLRSVIK
jgi:hypothetical protein